MLALFGCDNEPKGAERVTVTYDSNGGSDVKWQIVDLNTPATEPQAPQLEGMAFMGWYLNGEKWDFATPVASDITLVAKWEASYKISYELDGGRFDCDYRDYYTESESFSLTAPVKEGYFFLGWSESASEEIFTEISINGTDKAHRSFTAHWSSLKYELNSDGTATVTEYCFSPLITTLQIPDTVRLNGIDYTVTKLGDRLFDGMGKRIEEKEIKEFIIILPTTLEVIGDYVFNECIDVQLRVKLGTEALLNAYADALTVGEGNSHVLDVIKGRRPAFGWSIYG